MWSNQNQFPNQLDNQYQNQFHNQFPNQFHDQFPNQFHNQYQNHLQKLVVPQVPQLNSKEVVISQDNYFMNGTNQLSPPPYPLLSHQNSYPPNLSVYNNQRPPLVIPTITSSKPQQSKLPPSNSMYPIRIADVFENKSEENGTIGNKKKKYSTNTTMDSTEKKKQIRRERNREHAKHSRFRRRCLHEQLETLVKSLKDQNQHLRKCITDNLNEDEARQILAPFEKTASAILIASSNEEATKILESPDYPLIKALHLAQRSFVITDPRFHDNPIIFASQGFLDMTGYSKEEVIGRNCRFLQGNGTDPESINRIRTAIRNGTDCSVCLLNYRKDGSQFWNHFFISALRDKTNVIVGYVGVQCPVSDKHASVLLQSQPPSISSGCNSLLKRPTNEISSSQIRN